MENRTITVQISSTMDRENDFKEFSFPKVDELLESGWAIKDVISSTTNENVGFLYLTFVFRKI